MAKYLLEEIRSETATLEGSVVLEYFCHDSHKRNTALMILQSLLYQLLAKRSYLIELLCPQSSEVNERDTELTPGVLWEYLLTVLASPRVQSVCCLVDGLDECEDASQEIFWKLIETEFVHKELPADDARKKFRVLLTSRPTALAKKIGLLSQELDIQITDVHPDITRYIEHRVDRMTSAQLIPSDVSKLVTELLGAGANGMFLWVSLSMDQLEDVEESLSFYDILEVLRNVPRDIKGLYRRALERMQENEKLRARSKQIFEILLVAGDSLNVKAFALAMAPWPETCTTHSGLQQRSDIRFEYTSKRACGSLIRIDDDNIQLCHPSARHFLLGDARSHGLFSFDEKMSHAQLAQACLKYLMLEDIEIDPGGVGEESGGFPFLRYTLAHWPLHLRSSGDAIWTYSALIRRFFNTSNPHWPLACFHMPIYLKQACARDNDESILMHCLAFHDLPNVLRAVRFIPCFTGDAQSRSEPIAPIMEIGLEVDVRSSTNTTALMVAASFASLSTVQTLLDLAADADAMDDDHKTALHRAARGTDLEILRTLIKTTKDIDCRDWHGRTPLLCATDLRIVNEFLDAGAKIDAQRSDGKTSLHFAAQEGNQALVETLLIRGAATDTASHDGWTPLHAAAHHGSLEAVGMLLDIGVDPDSQSKTLSTPLFMASSNGHSDVIDVLLKAGARINHININGETPIHWAAGSGQVDSVIQLISAGSFSNMLNKFNDDPLTLACWAGHLKTVKLLLDKGSLAEGCSSSRLSGTNKYISANCLEKQDVDASNTLLIRSNSLFNGRYDYYRILDNIGWMGDVNMVRLLLDAGLDPNATDRFGRSTVSAATYVGNSSAVNLLLERGADPAKANIRGETPFHIAAEHGYDDILAMLLAHKVPINPQSYSGDTPLHEAVFNRRYGCIEQLIKAVENPLVTNLAGLSAMDIAARSHSPFVMMGAWNQQYTPRDPKKVREDLTAALRTFCKRFGSAQDDEKCHVMLTLRTYLFLAEEYHLYRVAVLLGLMNNPHPWFAVSYYCDMCDRNIDLDEETLNRCKTCVWDICKACMSRYDDERLPDGRLCSGHDFLSINIHDWHQIEPANGHEPEKELIVRERWWAEMEEKFGNASDTLPIRSAVG